MQDNCDTKRSRGIVLCHDCPALHTRVSSSYQHCVFGLLRSCHAVVKCNIIGRNYMNGSVPTVMSYAE